MGQIYSHIKYLQHAHLQPRIMKISLVQGIFQIPHLFPMSTDRIRIELSKCLAFTDLNWSQTWVTVYKVLGAYNLWLISKKSIIHDNTIIVAYTLPFNQASRIKLHSSLFFFFFSTSTHSITYSKT